jgi:type VI secretion system secreted protein VgrG
VNPEALECILDGVSDLLRQLQHEQLFSAAHRQIRLRPAESGFDDVLLPQRVVGIESICGGIEYRIDCLASTPRLPLKELIALPMEIQFVTDRGQLRSVCGLITEARAGDYDGSLSAFRLVVRDALAVMEKRTNSRIFRYQNELEIVQVLFDEWRHSNPVLANAFDYELDALFDMRQFPPREQTMQYNETDAHFVRRLLKRRGVSWYVRSGRSRHSTVKPDQDQVPAHTLVLFNNAALSLPQNAAGTVRYHREDATDQRDTITSWTAARTLQPGSATRHSWDYKNPLGGQFMTASARGTFDQGTNGNELAASLDDYVIEIPHAGNDVEDHWRLGQICIDRHSFEAKCFHGEGSVRDFCSGEHFELAGHPEIDTHPPDERQFIITELEVTARNNLPKDVDARAERLFARGRVHGGGVPIEPDTGSAERAGLVQIRFTAVRRGVPIVPHFDPRVDLPKAHLQSAIVVGPPGEEVHCDAMGRVKIRFPGMRAVDHKHAHGAGASDGPGDSAWVRVASNWAGNGPSSNQQCGTLGLPRVGTEVLVSFMGGDPDRPVILAQVFNQLAQPPALSSGGGLPGNRHLSGTRSREIGGQRGNQLRFDDTRGQISAQLASDHGASQLNLGWLTCPRADGSGEPRGEGAELRSDGPVAIRGGQGVLVTAEPAPEADGEQLGRAGLIGFIEVMHGVVDELARLAKEHSGDENSGSLAELTDKLKRWDAGTNVAPRSAAGGAPVVAMTAPAGIVLASADNLALGSEKKVDVVSVGDTEVSAGRNIFLRAARSISAFAHELGIKLVAGSDNVTVQADHGNVEIRSSGRISLISAQGIDLQAPEVRIVGHGAQTVWSSGTIIQQSAGGHIVKAAQLVHTGPGGGDPATPSAASTTLETDERAVLRHTQTGKPLPNMRYEVELDDGSKIKGVTDHEGCSDLLVEDLIRVAKVIFFREERL